MKDRNRIPHGLKVQCLHYRCNNVSEIRFKCHVLVKYFFQEFLYPELQAEIVKMRHRFIHHPGIKRRCLLFELVRREIQFTIIISCLYSSRFAIVVGICTCIMFAKVLKRINRFKNTHKQNTKQQ